MAGLSAILVVFGRKIPSTPEHRYTERMPMHTLIGMSVRRMGQEMSRIEAEFLI